MFQSSSLLCGSKLAVYSNNCQCNEQLKCIRLWYGYYKVGDMKNCHIVEQLPCFKDATINLEGSKLLEKDVECIAAFIISSTNKVWVEVNLTDCGINDCYIHMLYQRLHRCNNVTIEVLRLEQNFITGLCSSWISEMVVSCRLQKVWFNGNHGIGESEQLNCMLTDPCTNLRLLHMRNVKLSDTGAIFLFQVLQYNNILEELVVADNDITDRACAAITATLRKNNCLAKLWIWNNPIGGEGSKIIVEAVKYNNTLRMLVLPAHSESTQRIIASLQESINVSREGCKCQVTFLVDFL